MIELNGLVVAVILGMAVVTYVTKAGGLWLLGQIELQERTQAGLEALPGAIIIAIIAPELIAGGPAEWIAAAVAAIVVIRTDNLLVALGAAIGVLVLLRGF